MTQGRAHGAIPAFNLIISANYSSMLYIGPLIWPSCSMPLHDILRRFTILLTGSTRAYQAQEHHMKWVWFCILLFSQLSNAQDLLVVRGDGNYSPYEMEQDGVLTGFHIELTKVIAKQLDINLTFQSFPWKRALAMVENGMADAITYAGESAERKQYIIFTKGNELSWVIMDLVILNKRKNEIVVGKQGLMSLAQYQFGQMIGYSYGEEYDSANLKKEVFNKTEQLVGMLRNERIDIAIVNRYEFKDKNFNDSKSEEKLVVLDKVIEIPAFLGFSKNRNHYQLAKRFAKALVDYKQTQAFITLQKKFGARYK